MVPCSLKDIWYTQSTGEKLSSKHKVTGRKVWRSFLQIKINLQLQLGADRQGLQVKCQSNKYAGKHFFIEET